MRLLLAVGVVVLGSLAFAEDPLVYQSFEYSIQLSEVWITGFHCDAEEAIVPEEIDGLPVTTIFYNAFRNCEVLKRVVIPDSVGYIAAWAFDSCVNLTEVVLPENINISRGAFARCSSLVEVTIPEGVTHLDTEVFAHCTSLERVNLPASFLSVDAFNLSRIFYNCPNLTELHVDASNPAIASLDGVLFNADRSDLIYFPVGRGGTYTIPDGVRTIKERAFKDCIELKEVVLADSVVTLERWAFQNCTGLTRFTASEGLMTLQADALNGCTSLIDLYLGSSIEVIKGFAIANCSALENLTLPESVKTLEPYAFSGCNNLTEVRIPAMVSTMENAFRHCDQLLSINVDPANATYKSIDGVLFDASSTTLVEFPYGRSGDYTVPEGVLEIGDFAFRGHLKVTSLRLANSVRVLGFGAFADCAGLVEVDLPNGITTIGPEAFRACVGLTRISLPDSITSLGNSAFVDCTGLTGTFRFPRLLEHIELGTLRNCFQIEQVVLPEAVTEVGASAFASCSSLLEITLPDTVETIGRGAFYNCDALTEVTLPASLRRIEKELFRGCRNLETVRIPAGVMEIGESAFHDCPRLQAIEVAPENAVLMSIDGVLFDTVDSILLQYPTGRTGPYRIPDGVLEIGYAAFNGCQGLTRVEFPDGLHTIGQWGFRLCENLREIAFPDSLEILGASAFSDCISLTQLTLPPNVTTIGYAAFHNCWNLKRMVLPASLTTIDDWAFSLCYYLEDLYFLGEPPSLGRLVFQEVRPDMQVHYAADASGWGNDFWGWPAIPFDPWGGYAVIEVDGRRFIDTGSWLGWLFSYTDFIFWSYSLDGWIYIDEPESRSTGAWAYVPK